jgi:hypothetical protein
MPMTTRCSFLRVWTVVAAMGAATLGSGTAEAGDFASFDFSRYIPSSIRSKIEAHFDKAPAAKPKDDKAVGTSSPVSTGSRKPVDVVGPILPARVTPDNDCLSKQRLATGAVLFKDACTKEWAINTTSVAGHRVDRKCLTKNHHPNGIVMFRDICTDEWAMNTTEQPAAPPE